MEIESNRIESNRIEAKQIKSNQIKSISTPRCDNSAIKRKVVVGILATYWKLMGNCGICNVGTMVCERNARCLEMMARTAGLGWWPDWCQCQKAMPKKFFLSATILGQVRTGSSKTQSTKIPSLDSGINPENFVFWPGPVLRIFISVRDFVNSGPGLKIPSWKNQVLSVHTNYKCIPGNPGLPNSYFSAIRSCQQHLRSQQQPKVVLIT